MRLGLVEVLDFCSISDCGFSNQGCSSCVVCLPGMMLKILELVCVETGSQVAQTFFELSVTEAGLRLFFFFFTVVAQSVLVQLWVP